MKLPHARISSATLIVLIGILVFSCQAGQGSSGGPGGQGGQGGPGGSGGPGGGKGARNSAISVQAVEVSTGLLVAANDTAGVISPEVQSSVAANATGVVQSVVRKPGDWVSQGALILKLDDTQLQLNLKLARSNLDNARINLGLGTDTSPEGGSKLSLQTESAQSALASAQKSFASAEALYRLGGISGSDLDNARTQLQTAQANVENARMAIQQSQLSLDSATINVQQAQTNFNNASIRAPFAGQISAINVHPGEYVGSSTVVFVLVSNRRQVNFNVPPSDASAMFQGGKVSFSHSGNTYQATINQSPGAPINGLVPLSAIFGPSVELPFGIVGTIGYKVPLAEGLLVPVNALLSSSGKTYVFLVQDNKVIRQAVTILGQTGSMSALSGFSAPAFVVVSPPPGLLDGVAVQAIGSAQPTDAGAPRAGKQQ